MNMNLNELDLLSGTIEGLADNAGLEASVRAQIWSVVVLERTGDSARDPYRTATGFFDQGRATAFAQAVRSTCGSYCVLLYQGASLNSVISGDSSLLGMWNTRAGTANAAPNASEVSDVAVQAVSNNPTPVAGGGDFVDQSVT